MALLWLWFGISHLKGFRNYWRQKYWTSTVMHNTLSSSLQKLKNTPSHLPLHARVMWKPLMSHFRPTARVPRGCNTSALLISARASTYSRFSVSDPALHQQLRRGVGTIGYISSVEEAITKFVLRNCPWTYWIPRKKEEKKGIVIFLAILRWAYTCASFRLLACLWFHARTRKNKSTLLGTKSSRALGTEFAYSNAKHPCQQPERKKRNATVFLFALRANWGRGN